MTDGTQPEADSAEIVSHERRTPARPRDPVTSSSDSSSVPSPRTVTRYTVNVGGIELPVYLAREIDPILSALAETEAEFQRHKDQSFKLYIDACNRADKFQAALAEAEQENARLPVLKTIMVKSKGSDYHDKVAARFYDYGYYDEIMALTARAEAAEARIIELNIIMIAAEAHGKDPR